MPRLYFMRFRPSCQCETQKRRQPNNSKGFRDRVSQITNDLLWGGVVVAPPYPTKSRPALIRGVSPHTPVRGQALRHHPFDARRWAGGESVLSPPGQQLIFGRQIKGQGATPSEAEFCSLCSFRYRFIPLPQNSTSDPLTCELPCHYNENYQRYNNQSNILHFSHLHIRIITCSCKSNNVKDKKYLSIC